MSKKSEKIYKEFTDKEWKATMKELRGSMEKTEDLWDELEQPQETGSIFGLILFILILLLFI